MSQRIDGKVQEIIASMRPGKLAYEVKRAEKAGMTLIDWIKEKELKRTDINKEFLPEELLSNLLTLIQNKQYKPAQKLAIKVTKLYPNHPLGWKALSEVAQKNGRMREIIKFNKKIINLDETDTSAYCNLGNALIEIGEFDEAEEHYRKAISIDANCTEAYYNLGHKLDQDGNLDEAIIFYRKAIQSDSEFFEAHISLGNILRKNGTLDDAESLHKKAVFLRPDSAIAHYNLGITLGKLGKKGDAESSYRKAIELQPNLAEAHNNLGLIIYDIGNLEEAVLCFKRAIKFKVNFTEAYCNFGSVLREIGRIKEAEVNYHKAIELDKTYAEAYSNLAIINYINGETSKALETLKAANSIDPKSRQSRLLLGIMKSREISGRKTSLRDGLFGLKNNPLILNRPVEKELIASLYQINTRKLVDTGADDARYGHGVCSVGFDLFSTDHMMIKKLSKDLNIIMEEAVSQNVFVWDSFFNILGAGGGTTPHHHLNGVDNNKVLDIGSQKYSLVYYLSVGDQNCSQPGVLELFDPNEKVIPCEGMITIIPAGRKHSAVYNGQKDRIMIGVNFYSV